MIIQLASFNSILCKPSNIPINHQQLDTMHLYVDSSWTSLSCHGIGIRIITCQYLAQSHDQHNEYLSNQAFNAHGTYKHSSTFWWYPNKFGSSQVRSNILRHSLSISSGMFAIATIEVPLPSFLSIESSLIEIGLGVLPRGHEFAMCPLSRYE